MKNLTFGLILCGSGVKDGSEIHEATLTLLALDRLNVTIKFLSLNKDQHHVVDHTNDTDISGEPRNCLIESARIARGPVTNINSINIADFDAFIFPGGFGAAKNLCSFAFDGVNQTIDPTISNLISTAHQQSIPMGFLCISPVIPAKLIPNVTLTIGSDEGTAAAITEMGGKHVSATVSEIVVDNEHLVVSTPAYMLANSISELSTGIDALVDQVYNWAKKRSLSTSAAG